jgi:hypothetical protein
MRCLLSTVPLHAQAQQPDADSEKLLAIRELSSCPKPFQTALGYVVRGLRLTDKRARSGSPFRLFGTASVGSQSLTGIARLN